MKNTIYTKQQPLIGQNLKEWYGQTPFSVLLLSTGYKHNVYKRQEKWQSSLGPDFPAIFFTLVAYPSSFYASMKKNVRENEYIFGYRS